MAMDWAFIAKLITGIFYNSFILWLLPTYIGFVSLVAFLLLPKGGNTMKGKLLAITRKHALPIIMGYILISVIITSHSLYVNKPTKIVIPFATPDELISSNLQNKSFRIVDLAREDFIVRNKTFDNCHIYGPASIRLKGKSVMINSSIEGESPIVESHFIVTTNKYAYGPVVLQDCVIKNCTFHKISFMGSETQIAKFKASLNLGN